MAQATWIRDKEKLVVEKQDNRLKFIIGGLLMIAAVVILASSALRGNAQLFLTVDEYYAQQNRFVGRDLRVSGWVLGDSIQFRQIDATTSRLEFDIVDDMKKPGQRLHIVAINEPVPDLLQHEAQAIVEGRAAGSSFTANRGGLFLKCPTRYEEMEPDQSD